MHVSHTIIRTRLSIQAISVIMASNNLMTESNEKSKIKSAQHCCVPFCNSDSRYNQNLHFHHIPKDPERKKQWIIKIRRDEGPNFKVSAATVVCSKHFKKDDYKSWTPVKKLLQKTAVPSIFDWSQEKEPRRALKRKLLSPTSDHDMSDAPMQSIDEQRNLTSEYGSGEEILQPRHEHKRDQEIADLKIQLEMKTKECESLKASLQLEKFGITRFSHDNSMIKFYTGFQTYQLFLKFFKCIEPTAQNIQSAYYIGSETISLAGRKRCMLLIDEFFMFLCRLRAGLIELDLSVRFNCSLSTVSRKIITWANFLYFVLGSIPIWLSREDIQKQMPECFKSLYPNTRVIIDCTEIKTQQPSSLVLNSQLYSNYKGTNTFKALLGIAPHGAITFISSLYTGCMSDIEVTKLSGVLDLIEPGDDVMADKGFTIKKLLEEKGATLNIPAFLQSKKMFTQNEIDVTEQIAQLRIHIERMNRRIKENHLFDTPIPMTLAGSINQIWTVSCLLANFNGPIVSSWS